MRAVTGAELDGQPAQGIMLDRPRPALGELQVGGEGRDALLPPVETKMAADDLSLTRWKAVDRRADAIRIVGSDRLQFRVRRHRVGHEVLER